MITDMKIKADFRKELILSLVLFFFLLSGCSHKLDENQLADEVVLYDWEGDIPQSVLDSFTAEYGVKVRYEAYESQEEAIDNMMAGKIYDVIVMENRFIPSLIDLGLLAELNYENILNFKNISPNFRGLTYDPTNQFSIPYSWGTTGLVVRNDLIQEPIQRWRDLWDPRYAGQVAIWIGQPRETLALTLKSLGYSANSENPAELEAALKQLVTLKPALRFIEDFDQESVAPALASGEVIIAMGYSGDFITSQDIGLPVEYILPEEGPLLWGDNFVIAANSQNKYTAETFLNFLLRPEISAEITNQSYYASDNEAAWAYVVPEILNNPAIFPREDILQNAEIVLPLSDEGKLLYDKIWLDFLDAEPTISETQETTQ